MAGDWIPIRHRLRDAPEVIGIADRTGLDRDTVVGKLARVWEWADSETVDGRFCPSSVHDVSIGCPHVDAQVAHEGFARAMLEVGWLVPDGSKEGAVMIPDFTAWMGKSAKGRLKHAIWKRKYRLAPGGPVSVSPVDKTRTTEQNSTDKISPPTPPLGDEVNPSIIPSELEQALVDAFGVPATVPEKRRRKRTLAQLAKIEATLADIAHRIAGHRRLWPHITVTEASLLRHWTACGRGREPRPGDLG